MRLAGAFALVLLPAAASASTEFALGGGGAVVVPVFVDGHGPLRFRLDTGAAGTAVTAQVAEAAGLRAVERTVVVTPLGEETRAAVRIGRLRAGDAAAEGLLATVVPALPDGAAGILGQDFLSRFDLTIDYRRRRISWDGSAADGVRVPLHAHEGIYLVDLVQRGTAARFVPDTGASALVVFEGAHGPRLRSDGRTASAEVVSASGRRARVETGRLRGLSIGGLALGEQVAAFVPRDDAHAGGGDGLLPLHQFQSVTFAGRDGYLVIRP
jgi:predicted aspartyl protease